MNIPNLKPMKCAADATQMLFDLKFIVLDNCSTINFVTSDNPICKYNKLYITRKYDRNYGWGSAGLIILLPLSPKKCLCLYDSNVYSCESQNSIILKSSSKVTQINKLLTRNSYYNIFFDNSQPLSYINNIKKSYQYVPIENCLKEHFNGQLIQINQCSILENYSLDFLTIKPLYKTIELPLHMAGLIRPIAKKYIQQNPERFFEKT